MSNRLIALLVVLALFGALTVVALSDVGYWGIIEPHFQSWGAAQVLADLVIMCVLGSIWMVVDARRRGATAWPYLIITLVAGSFGPLLYLAMRELSRESAQMPVAAGANSRIS